jgi:formiminotetrahydrofolate cyclodeaminase
VTAPLSEQSSIAAWSDAIAAGTPSPAGGAAAALAAALAAAVVALAGRLATAAGLTDAHPETRNIPEKADVLRHQLLGLAPLDTRAYGALAAAEALPDGNAAEHAAREEALAGARMEAAQVQYDLLTVGERVVRLGMELVEHSNATGLADGGTAGLLAAAACRSAYWNLREDLVPMADQPAAEALLAGGRTTLQKVEAMELAIIEELGRRLSGAT